MGLAGLGQAEASQLTWGDMDWTGAVRPNYSNGSLSVRRKKTGKPFWISPLSGEDFNDYELRVGSDEAGKSLIAIGQSVAS